MAFHWCVQIHDLPCLVDDLLYRNIIYMHTLAMSKCLNDESVEEFSLTVYRVHRENHNTVLDDCKQEDIHNHIEREKNKGCD